MHNLPLCWRVDSLEHTHFTSQLWSLPVFRFPCPSSAWPKSRTITKYKQTCAQAKTSKNETRSMSLFLCSCVFKVLYTVGRSPERFSLPQATSVAEPMVPVQNLLENDLYRSKPSKHFRTLSPENYAARLRQSYDALLMGGHLANH